MTCTLHVTWDDRLVGYDWPAAAGCSARARSYDTGHDPADPVDQAIMATRKAVFPLHGLMP